ncbi:MBOAT family O-acyltransferase [Prochlorococcus marinus]|uniref:MBOAT family O-acyltransferase n=1 Tax=Prochlorococcus marinus TaxID=1219 RepID=UPI0039AFAE58
MNESFTLEKVILPVGISFYIFQSMTYVIDIYLRKIKPETNIVNYFTYISFFPQLVAGPIERASSLLPQFNKLHNITKRNLYSGLKLVIIGLFLKVVIADNLGVYVDRIFKTYEDLNGGSLLLGAISFAIQIYGDFCGYSLIAIGVAKIMGFVLMENFDTPYFSTSIQQFWKRWHISLSSFFKDYIYIPLGGSRVQNKYLAARNILVTFFVSGIWHGANWTFILWGSIHGFLLVIQRNINVKIPKILSWILTISVVLLLWVLFRSETIPDAFIYLSKIFREFDIPDIGKGTMIYFFYFLVVDLLLSYYKKIDEIWFGKYFFQNYILFFMLVLVLGSNSANSNFIYFEF